MVRQLKLELPNVFDVGRGVIYPVSVMPLGVRSGYPQGLDMICMIVIERGKRLRKIQEAVNCYRRSISPTLAG